MISKLVKKLGEKLVYQEGKPTPIQIKFFKSKKVSDSEREYLRKKASFASNSNVKAGMRNQKDKNKLDEPYSKPQKSRDDAPEFGMDTFGIKETNHPVNLMKSIFSKLGLSHKRSNGKLIVINKASGNKASKSAIRKAGQIYRELSEKAQANSLKASEKPLSNKTVINFSDASKFKNGEESLSMKKHEQFIKKKIDRQASNLLKAIKPSKNRRIK